MNLRKDHLHDVYPLSNQNLTVRLGPFYLTDEDSGATGSSCNSICGYGRVPWDNPNKKTFLNCFSDLRIFNPFTTFSDGSLGSSIDEGRSKMR